MTMTDKMMCDCESIHLDKVENAKKNMKSYDDYVEFALLFKLFGDSTRVRILHALEQNELCVCDIAALLDMTKSAVSHQLKALKMANLVKFRRDGQIVYYSLADSHVKTILDIGFEHISEE